MCVLPNFVLLPFARRELNGLVLGADLTAVINVLPNVFLLTLLGYFALLTGRHLWRFTLGLGLRNAMIRVLDIVPQCSIMIMSSTSVLVSQSWLFLSLHLLVLRA